VKRRSTKLLIAAALLAGAGLPALAQESLLPPGFGNEQALPPPAPAPAPTQPQGPAAPAAQPGVSSEEQVVESNLTQEALPPGPGGVNPVGWVAARAWLLLRMGEADAARMLVSGVDVADCTPKMTQVAVQSALATADPAALCPIQDGIDEVEPTISPLVQAIC